MSVATNVIPLRTGVKPEGAVVADIENGYCKLANELLDSICQLDISGSQYQVLMAVIRCTYGYNKKEDRVTNTYLVTLTGLSEKAVRDALNTLSERNVITCEKQGIMKLISVNKVVSDWSVKSNKAANMRKGTEQMHRSKCSTQAEQMLREDGANAPKRWSKCTNTKDNLNTTNQIQPTKDNQRATAPKNLDYSQWPSMPSEQTLKDWFAMRKNKKALVSQTVINRMAKQLQIAANAGLTVDDCLAEAVTRGWTGFEAEWMIRRGNQAQTRFPQAFAGQNYVSGDL
ncbi:MAG TPA: hypothetical protein DCS87_11775 [Rheinheimera sp.]|nr:hypothetical protein [Rheinheimera sp.]